MNTAAFCQLLESITSLTERQKTIVIQTLFPEEEIKETSTHNSLLPACRS